MENKGVKGRSMAEAQAFAELAQGKFREEHELKGLHDVMQKYKQAIEQKDQESKK